MVVLPESELQVIEVLRLCREFGVPVVPRGAGTGLSGGARPQHDGVVLGLSKMNQILQVDADNCVARLQPGVRNAAISEAAASHGLYYAPDPSSQIACSIGGKRRGKLWWRSLSKIRAHGAQCFGCAGW